MTREAGLGTRRQRAEEVQLLDDADQRLPTAEDANI